MFNRHFFVFALLVAVIGMPALIYESAIFQSTDSNSSAEASPFSEPTGQYDHFSLNPSEYAAVTASRPAEPSLNGELAQPSPVPAQLTSSPPAAPIKILPFSTGIPGQNRSTLRNGLPSGSSLKSITNPQLAEVFRFDISPQWVKSRWERVSVTSTDYGLKAMRVALVTGTDPSDLHGALTYYFDKQKQLQRITLRGWSGDATRLVNMVTHKYGFKAQNTHMSGLYIAKPFLNVKGALLMQDAAVIDAKNPTQQVAISMEINNPGGAYILSPEFATMLPR